MNQALQFTFFNSGRETERIVEVINSRHGILCSNPFISTRINVRLHYFILREDTCFNLAHTDLKGHLA